MLLAITPDDTSTGVGWAEELRATNRIESYALTPATLEDAYLALTVSHHDDEEELTNA